jgi:hypothetical protein
MRSWGLLLVELGLISVPVIFFATKTRRGQDYKIVLFISIINKIMGRESSLIQWITFRLAARGGRGFPPSLCQIWFILL